VLLSELHHRVKNNLQTVASLLSLGLRHATAPEARLVLEESRTRIQSIAAVHDLLSQGDVGLTTVGDVARKMAEIAEQGAAPQRRSLPPPAPSASRSPPARRSRPRTAALTPTWPPIPPAAPPSPCAPRSARALNRRPPDSLPATRPIPPGRCAGHPHAFILIL